MLLQLKQLLECERTAARTLDMRQLEETLRDKAGLVTRLRPLEPTAPDMKTLALLGEIQREQRRNLRLCHAAMHAILGIWSAHCRHAGRRGYDPQGAGIAAAPGRMLSGKI